MVIYEPSHEKTYNLGFKPGLVQSQKQARSLKFQIEEEEECTICVAKTKVLICLIVFAFACFWFSNAVAHFYYVEFHCISDNNLEIICLHVFFFKTSLGN